MKRKIILSSLPEKWVIERTPENVEMISKWAQETYPARTCYDVYHMNQWKYIHSGPDNCIQFNHIQDGYTEINTQELKYLVLGEKLKVSDLKENECIHVSTEEEDRQIRELLNNACRKWCTGRSYLEGSTAWTAHKKEAVYIVKDNQQASVPYVEAKDYTIYPASYFTNTNNTNMNTDKEVIGYILKPEYKGKSIETGACKIAYESYNPTQFHTFKSDGCDFLYQSECKDRLEKAGVLNLWFNPVYAPEKPRYSIGEWVTVINAKDDYPVNETFKIENIFNCNNDPNIKYVRKPDVIYGIKASDVRPATPEEIAAASTETIQMAEGFQLTIRDKKVFHKEEDITSYVVDMVKWKNSTNALGDSLWKMQIKDVIFSTTGCQQKETKLSQWLAIYDKIK